MGNAPSYQIIPGESSKLLAVEIFCNRNVWQLQTFARKLDKIRDDEMLDYIKQNKIIMMQIYFYKMCLKSYFVMNSLLRRLNYDVVLLLRSSETFLKENIIM